MGSPIGFIILNENQKEADYAHLKDTFRPSHADFTYEKNMTYGIIEAAEEVAPEKQQVE